MKKGKKTALIAICVLLALIIAGGAAGVLYINKLNKNLQGDDATLDDLRGALSDVSSLDDPFWMLLLGVDTTDDVSRTDTIILTYVDPGNNRVILISIPRDTKAFIEGVGYTKINAAHAYGGPSLTVKTVAAFANVEISHYAEINLKSLYNLVDTLGGVEVNVPVYVSNLNCNGIPFMKNGHDIEPGLQTLDATQSIVFCRSRYYDNGDFQRQANQRIFLKALAKKILAADPATMLKCIDTISSSVTTDLSASQIYTIAQSMKNLDADSIANYTVPSGTGMEGGISYVIAYDAEWQQMIQTIKDGGIPEAQDKSIAGEEATKTEATAGDTETDTAAAQ